MELRNVSRDYEKWKVSKVTEANGRGFDNQAHLSGLGVFALDQEYHISHAVGVFKGLRCPDSLGREAKQE